MAITNRNAIWRLASCMLFLAAPGLAQTQLSPAEQEVWQLEEKYWKYAQSYDLQSYSALWHERFVGWPRAEATPVGKSKVGAWLTRHRDAGDSLRYQLRREAVRQVDGPVVVHYSVTAKWTGKDGKTQSDELRITHTWLKDGGSWKIITGMSAPVEKSAGK
jgi:ketosteroid isomerase-like protein